MGLDKGVKKVRQVISSHYFIISPLFYFTYQKICIIIEVQMVESFENAWAMEELYRLQGENERLKQRLTFADKILTTFLSDKVLKKLGWRSSA